MRYPTFCCGALLVAGKGSIYTWIFPLMKKLFVLYLYTTCDIVLWISKHQELPLRPCRLTHKRVTIHRRSKLTAWHARARQSGYTSRHSLTIWRMVSPNPSWRNSLPGIGCGKRCGKLKKTRKTLCRTHSPLRFLRLNPSSPISSASSGRYFSLAAPMCR